MAGEGRGPAGSFPSNVALSRPLAVEETHLFVFFFHTARSLLGLICFLGGPENT